MSTSNHSIEYLYDVQYSSLSERLKLDLFQPAHATGNLPLIIYIHGGGWVDRDKSCKYYWNFLDVLAPSFILESNLRLYLRISPQLNDRIILLPIYNNF